MLQKSTLSFILSLMHDHGDHDELIDQVAREYADVLNNSKQSVYIYLDDNHKVCNEKFAQLLGYDSAKEWADVKESFPNAFVAEKSQEKLVDAYQNAMEDFVGSEIDITWKKKSGEEVETEVILVPISFQNHLLAIHFIEE